jgi:DtxR family Mn-dependent transcriptional regulator
MTHIGDLGESLEDYLEIILQLVQEKGEARAKDIARAKGVRMASVTGALRRLAAEGLIDYRAREIATLTQDGHELANRVLQRHEFISRFFTEILGVSEETASRDACSIEHVISLETLDRLAGFVEFLRGCPRAGDGLIQRFKDCYDAGRRELNGQGGVPLSCRTSACLEAFGPEAVGLFSRDAELTTLDQLQPGQRARVVNVRAATEIRQRLLDLGLLPGVEVGMHRVAPLGDPIDIKLKGFHLSLRKAEAATIGVERI